jgi:uncharacterized protein (TIGR02266 family)
MASRFTIVLVDGTAIESELRGTLFQRRPFQVVAAQTAAEAVDLALTGQPQLVILGWTTPAADGLDACRRIRSCPETRMLPVIVVVDEDSAEARTACEQVGATATLERTASLETWVQVIAAVLGIPARRPVRMTVLFNVESGGPARESLGRAVNISDGGLGLEVDRRYEVSTDLRLHFQLPGQARRIHAGARVRWIKPQGEARYAMGLEFTDLPADHRGELNRYLDAFLATPLPRPASQRPSSDLSQPEPADRRGRAQPGASWTTRPPTTTVPTRDTPKR